MLPKLRYAGACQLLFLIWTPSFDWCGLGEDQRPKQLQDTMFKKD